MSYNLFYDISTTPIFGDGEIGSKRLIDAKMMRPICKAVYAEVMHIDMYKRMLSSLALFLEDYAYRNSLNYVQGVKRLTESLCKGKYANEKELITFANIATVCTFAAVRWCLANAFPSYFAHSESLKPIVRILKVSQTNFVIGFRYDGFDELPYEEEEEENAYLIDKYAREGAKTAIADLRRCGIIVTYKEANGYYQFDINLAKSFGKEKEYAISEAEYRLNPPEGNFNFDDPLAGLPFADEE